MRRTTVGSELTLERLDLEACDWGTMDAYSDREVFQTREWLEFIRRTQDAEPVVAAVILEGETVGFFTGGVIRRFGLRLLGSPFPGWTTGALGFNLKDGISRSEALAALPRFAWRELGCVHLEIKDRRLEAADLTANRFRHSPYHTFEIDLAADEEQLLTAMSSACRRAIRKSVKEGVTIEEADGDDFADEFYAQLVEVFAKQDLKPPYDADRVRELVRCVHPGGRLLLLRAVAPDGTRIATGIFPAMNRTAWFWGGASWRSHQILRPNEAIFWYAMRHWKDRGITVLDTGGGGDYKRKYGVRDVIVPMGRTARIPGLVPLRDIAARAYARAAFGGRA
jgi:CelD/BcsL family acetyltransferase involved in cellulose biosynthesis